MDDQITLEVTRAILSARNVVAITGAGISTEAGIPDFRSPGSGLWTKMSPFLFTRWGFRFRPRTLWELGQQFFNDIWNAECTVAHRFLALLEEKGILKGVITQNVDNLHQKAGSKKVIEVHGHLRTGTCLKCKRVYPMDEIMTKLNVHGEVPPRCDKCKKAIKPDVVLFGDPLPKRLYREAMNLARGCDLLLILGSSLVVYPVANLPKLALRNGANLIVMNLQPTPYDSLARTVVHRPLGQFCQGLLDRIERI